MLQTGNTCVDRIILDCPRNDRGGGVLAGTMLEVSQPPGKGQCCQRPAPKGLLQELLAATFFQGWSLTEQVASVTGHVEGVKNGPVGSTYCSLLSRTA